MYDAVELSHLLTEARNGNNQALGAMLAQLRPWMRRQAEGHLGHRLRARMDGSDIVQDVHIRAFERFDQFQGNSVAQLLVWVKVILSNVIKDCFKKNAAAKADAGREEAGGDPAELQGHGTTPSQGAMRLEDQARLEKALQSLKEKEQQVFQMRIYDGLPFNVVAQRLGVTVGNARVLMVRAIEKLKSVLRDEHER